MTGIKDIVKDNGRHRMIFGIVLCLFGLLILPLGAVPKGRKAKAKQDPKVYLIHADILKYDIYGPTPDAQIAKGKVHFMHQGAQLWCDSAYFYQAVNAVKAFGHVRFKQDDMTLTCERAHYDGQTQQMFARENVVMKRGKQTLYTDSLNYDRLYDYAYFFEGGRLIDGKDKLVADWGEYNTKTREAIFYYNVKMNSGNRVITTEELHYDREKSKAHVVGPSTVKQNGSVIHTSDAYFNTETDYSELFGRSTIEDSTRVITGDSLYYDKKTGLAQGFGNVIYVDKKNKNELHCGRMRYNEKTGKGWATVNALAKDYSRKDTLYVHADSMKIYTFHINTDSVYRKVHCFDHVKAYRVDVQAVCDSMVINTKDSCMTMYRDPIVWNGGRQLLGERIDVYMNDSTIRYAKVTNQALSVELLPDKKHYNQVSSKLMDAIFVDGVARFSRAMGNVKTIYYPQEENDSSLMSLVYMETDTMKMYMSPQRKLERIWTPKNSGTWYPITQIPPNKYKLPEFAWFEELRPTDPADVMNWRGKGGGQTLKVVKRHEAPLQKLGKQ